MPFHTSGGAYREYFIPDHHNHVDRNRYPASYRPYFRPYHDQRDHHDPYRTTPYDRSPTPTPGSTKLPDRDDHKKSFTLGTKATARTPDHTQTTPGLTQTLPKVVPTGAPNGFETRPLPVITAKDITPSPSNYNRGPNGPTGVPEWLKDYPFYQGRKVRKDQGLESVPGG